MRVLYLNASGQMGGAESSLLGMLDSLRTLHPEWDISLLLGEDGPLSARAAEIGVSVHVLAFPEQVARLSERSGPVGKAVRSLAKVLSYRSKLAKAMKKIRPDVVHSNSLKMHLLAAAITRRVHGCSRVRICHVHEYISSRRIMRRLLPLIARRFDVIVANSRSVAEDLLACKIPPQKLRLIYNGVSLRTFAPGGRRLDLDRLSGLTPARRDVLRVGLLATFAKWKGHTTFLRALALLPADLKFRAYVLGGPIYQTAGSQYTREELRREAKEICPGLEIGFTGVVAAADEGLRALDIVVHASTEPEPFGMVIIEAMACGRPVVVSKAGGVAEIISEDFQAVAHTPGDSVMLANKIERLARDLALQQRLAESGRRMVEERFSADVMAQKFADLYRECAMGGRVQIEDRCFV